MIHSKVNSFKETIIEITPEILDFYFRRNDWKKIDSQYSGLSIYINPKDENIKLLIPKQRTSDYLLHIKNAVELISEIENKNITQIVNNILSLDRDFHNYRVLTVSQNSIKLSTAEQVLASARKIFELSAKKEYDKSNFSIKENKRDKIASYINSCRFTHTWKGSFGFTVTSPLNAPSLGLFDDTSDTYERMVSKRIFRGFKIINEAVLKNSSDYIVDNSDIGFDGNMCNKLLVLSEKLENNSVEYSITWGPVVKIQSEFTEPKSIKLDRKSFNLAEKAALKLSEKSEQFETRFNGFPTSLRSDKEHLISKKEFGERYISVRGSSREIKSATLKMELEINDYLAAVKAHKEGRDVRVFCVVKRKHKGWEVLKVKQLKVL